MVTRVRHPAPPMYIKEDADHSQVPLVALDGIRNGALIGSVSSGVRLIARGKHIVPSPDGSFAIRDTTLLTNHIVIDIPDGMRFVASKRGTKFYPVASASAQNIVPANRVYFPDEESAWKAGFVR